MNEKIKLTHFKKSSNKPINLVFKNVEDCINYIDSLFVDKDFKILPNDGTTIFLASFKELGVEDFKVPIFIDDSICIFSDMMQHYFFNDRYEETLTEIHIQEYGTWEDAYLVAIDMRECSPICRN